MTKQKKKKFTKQQKKQIKKWFDDNWQGQGSVYSIDQMQPIQSSNILALNDHETFWQNADRYINDLALEKMYN